MDIKDKRIDGGKAFDWGKTSADYAKYRDIYPESFYETIAQNGLCVEGQRVLDIGTGTGVLPRNMYKYGARWTAADISDNQIKAARELSAEQGMNICYYVSPAEKLGFADSSFDVITACQCFWYFDHAQTAPLFARLLSQGGRLAFLMMNWLPYEDKLVYSSEQLVLKYNPSWTGSGDRFKEIAPPGEYLEYFDVEKSLAFRLPVHFTRENWNGRMKACRGVGASLSEENIARWEAEHKAMLASWPEEFDVLHYAAMIILKKK